MSEPDSLVKLSDAEKIEAMCALIIGGMSKTEAIRQIFGHGLKFWEVEHKSSAYQIQVAKALECRADQLVDEATRIADTDPDPNRARNRIAVRQWIASKLKPKSYGDRMEMAITHSISVNEALTTARGRMLPVEDSAAVLDAEIVAAPESPATEDNPNPAPWADIFS